MKRSVISLTLAMIVVAALAACDNERGETEVTETTTTTAQAPAIGREGTEQAQEAAATLNEAATVVQKMKADANLQTVMKQAKAIFIVPDYGKVALGVGGRGGEGVLYLKQNGTWAGPAFYDFGGLSVGLQAGAEAGQIAMLLMTDKAMGGFMGENNFSLDAAAGLTIVDYSAEGQESTGQGDVILWSDAEGAFAGAEFSATDINFDEEENAAFYGANVTAQQVLQGQATSTQPNPLQGQLPV